MSSLTNIEVDIADLIKPRPEGNRPFSVREKSFSRNYVDRVTYQFLLSHMGIKSATDVQKTTSHLKEVYAPLESCNTTKSLYNNRVSEIYDKTNGYSYGPLNMEIDSRQTTYVRASNDYTMAPMQEHERFARANPANTAVVSITNMPYSELDGMVEFIIGELKRENSDLELVMDNSISFHDDNESESEDEYSLYFQKCLVFSDKTNKQVLTIELLSGIKATCITFFKSAGLRTDIIDRVIENKQKFKTYVAKKKEATFYTISQNSRGFVLEDLEIRKRLDGKDILDNYNDDFAKANDVINECIDEDKRGLILLHGIPGSGKTSYIKHLITKSGNRKIVYIPPHLAVSIASPHFISFVKSELANSVLVIEDAEQILLSRENIESHKEAVSNILNMTDGILADALNILIICTFNTDMENIDSALRRKGRMMLQYKFTELTVDKTNALTEKLYGKKINKALPLSEIFNLDYDLITPTEKPKVAFGFRPG